MVIKMELLWQNNQVFCESGMFLPAPRINLMFPAEKITEVKQHSTGKVFEAGKDFCHTPGDDFITRPDGSEIPFFPESAIHPTENLRFHPDPDANAISDAVDGGNLLFNNKDFFALNQIDITYQAAAVDFDPELTAQSERLPRFREMLADKKPLQVTLIGDSISEGYNATKFVNIPPFAPCYMEMACNELGDFITFRNRAIGGTGIQHACRIENDYQGDHPDLLVIAYGMNNFAAMPIEEFLNYLQQIITKCQAVNPHTEYLILTSMSGNPLWKRTVPGPDALYAEKIREFVNNSGTHIALADAAKVWQKFLARKGFYDMTGNGVNHPNDYGHRIYASVVLELLTGKKYFN